MSNSLFSSEWIASVYSDLWSLHLAMIGCLVSVFTLLYSFIISKRENLKLYAEQISKDGRNPTVIQKQQFAVNYIKRMSRVANYCLALLLCNILLSIGNWIGMKVLDGLAQNIIFILISFFTVVVFGFVIYLCIKVFMQYLSDIKI